VDLLKKHIHILTPGGKHILELTKKPYFTDLKGFN